MYSRYEVRTSKKGGQMKDKSIGIRVSSEDDKRYLEMIREIQIRFAPINKTDAVKMLLDAGAKTLLKGERNVRNA